MSASSQFSTGRKFVVSAKDSQTLSARRLSFNAKEVEFLCQNFSRWLSSMSEMEVDPDLSESLKSGIVLLIAIEKYLPHITLDKWDRTANPDSFKARDNIRVFGEACVALGMRKSDTINYTYFEKKELRRITSMLCYFALLGMQNGLLPLSEEMTMLINNNTSPNPKSPEHFSALFEVGEEIQLEDDELEIEQRRRLADEQMAKLGQEKHQHQLEQERLEQEKLAVEQERIKNEVDQRNLAEERRKIEEEKTQIETERREEVIRREKEQEEQRRQREDEEKRIQFEREEEEKRIQFEREEAERAEEEKRIQLAREEAERNLQVELEEKRQREAEEEAMRENQRLQQEQQERDLKEQQQQLLRQQEEEHFAEQKRIQSEQELCRKDEEAAAQLLKQQQEQQMALQLQQEQQALKEKQQQEVEEKLAAEKQREAQLKADQMAEDELKRQAEELALEEELARKGCAKCKNKGKKPVVIEEEE